MRILALFMISSALLSTSAQAKFVFSPYYSLTSTKKIDASKDNKDEENAVNKTREEYGLKTTFSMYKLIKAEFSVGQSILNVTEKTQYAADEFEEIDYIADMNMDPTKSDFDVKTTDEITNAKFGLILDPSFSIFILRTKLGVQANKRKLTLQQGQSAPVVNEPPITYKPYAGAGLGIRFSRNMFWMIEYNGYFYRFPDTEPFQREVSVSFALKIGKK